MPFRRGRLAVKATFSARPMRAGRPSSGSRRLVRLIETIGTMARIFDYTVRRRPQPPELFSYQGQRQRQPEQDPEGNSHGIPGR